MEESTDSETTVGGLSPELAGALAYIFAPVSGILLFVLEDENEFVRFHGMQSLLYGVISWLIISITSAFLIGLLLVPVQFVLLLYFAYKAYKGSMFEIPVIGGIAKDQV